MTEHEPDEASQPRKRIAVACGRCRKRKIRCSGDPGNGGPCSNCKSAGHEPCLFLRVSSTETPLREGPSDYGYNVDAARSYQGRGPASQHGSVSQYSADISTGDMMSYRHGTYPYSNSSSTGSKGYYSSWGGGYGEESVDYGLNYSSYPSMSQDPVHLVSSYRSGRAPVYVDPEASSYSYGNLVHRPAASHDLPALSLSGMAASLPTPDRTPTKRSLPGTRAYRTNGLPGHYSTSKTSAAHSSDVGYTGLTPGFESPVSYGSAAVTLPSSMSSRSGHAETSGYSSAASAGSDSLYGPDHSSSYRGVHEADSYIYGDRVDSSRRDSHASGGGGGSVLSNGQVYVPDTQPHASAHHHGYPVAAPSSSQVGDIDGATASAGNPGGSVASQVHSSGPRRSAGSLRGA